MLLLQEIRKAMDEMNCVLEQVTNQIIFMSTYNDIVLEDQKNKSTCIANSVSCAAEAPSLCEVLTDEEVDD